MYRNQASDHLWRDDDQEGAWETSGGLITFHFLICVVVPQLCSLCKNSWNSTLKVYAFFCMNVIFPLKKIWLKSQFFSVYIVFDHMDIYCLLKPLPLFVHFRCVLYFAIMKNIYLFLTITLFYFSDSNLWLFSKNIFLEVEILSQKIENILKTLNTCFQMIFRKDCLTIKMSKVNLIQTDLNVHSSYPAGPFQYLTLSTTSYFVVIFCFGFLATALPSPLTSCPSLCSVMHMPQDSVQGSFFSPLL